MSEILTLTSLFSKDFKLDIIRSKGMSEFTARDATEAYRRRAESPRKFVT